MNIINTWQLNLICYLICVTIFYHYYKIAVKHSDNDRISTISLQLIAGIFSMLLIPVQSFKLPSEPKIYLLLLLASVFYAANNRLQTTVRKHLDVSSFTILNQMTQVFMIIFSIIIFKDRIPIHGMIGACLILSGNSVLFLRSGNFKYNRYVALSVLSALSAAAGIALSLGISRQFNLPFYISLTFLIPALILSISAKTQWRSLILSVRNNFSIYTKTGMFWSLSALFSLRALSYGHVSTIVPLQSTTVFINVAIAYIILKDRKDSFRKAVSAGLVIMGVIAQYK